ncbi:protein MIX23 [Microplitis mediator]|uniref:protein MIX23 n=1 Tax=Microplitis mediator TaxID=375433 RepID=UPI002555AFE2|nr:protein MIX23 [Microplitis mediator]
MAASSGMECGDFLEFQDSLQKMRQLDDKIIYLLNTTIPTESFKGQVDATATCKDLFQRIQSGHAQREIAIKKCMDESREKVKKFKEAKDKNPDDISVLKQLRKEQTTLRLLESELGVEEIVKNRTNQIYLTKCRGFYKPNTSDS